MGLMLVPIASRAARECRRLDLCHERQQRSCASSAPLDCAKKERSTDMTAAAAAATISPLRSVFGGRNYRPEVHRAQHIDANNRRDDARRAEADPELIYRLPPGGICTEPRLPSRTQTKLHPPSHIFDL